MECRKAVMLVSNCHIEEWSVIESIDKVGIRYPMEKTANFTLLMGVVGFQTNS